MALGMRPAGIRFGSVAPLLLVPALIFTAGALVWQFARRLASVLVTER